MKKLVLGGAIVAAVAVAVPYMSGSMARTQIKESVSLINDAKHGLKLEYNVLSEGIYSSVVSLSAEIDPEIFSSANMGPAEQAMAVQFLSGDINVKLSHGPLVLTDQAVFGLAAFNLDKSWDIPQSDSTLNAYVRGVAQPNNAGVIELGVKPFSVSVDGQGSISFSGISVQTDCSSSKCDISGGSEAIVFNNNDSNVFTMDSLTLSGNFENNPALIYSGGLYDSVIKMELAKMSVPGAFNGADIGLDASSALDETTGIGDMSMSYRVGQLEIGGERISDAVVSIEINNIVNSALVELQKATQGFTGSPAIDEDAMSALAENLAVLMNEGVEFNMTELALTMGGGSLNGESKLQLQSNQVNEALLANPGFWLSSLTGSAKLSVEMPLARKIAELQVAPNLAKSGVDLSTQEGQVHLQQAVDMTIQQFVQMGIFVVEGDTLRLDYEKSATAQVINGRQMPM